MIKINKLCKSFQRPGEDALHVLRNLDFRVDAGEFVAIVGASGSGKTTLMNILGLLDRADSGDYELHDKSVENLSSEERARVRNETIGFVFQQFHLLPRTTATENVELPLLYSTRGRADREPRPGIGKADHEPVRRAQSERFNNSSHHTRRGDRERGFTRGSHR